MFKSNIVAGSNVFLSYEDNPCFDEYFIKQIQDYHRLKEIADRQTYDKRVPELNKSQKEILKTEMRCVYARNDPCWGYKKSIKKVASACIQGECPNILKCNPEYHKENAEYWTMTNEERNLYGDPNSLRYYYKVDMVSDEEMLRYDVYPVNEGLEYPMLKNPVHKEKKLEKKNPNMRINPSTGRKEVVIGYRWVITDNASYENEMLCSIWGYVEDAEKHVLPQRRKTVKIDKKIVDTKPVQNVQKMETTISKSDSSVKVYEEAVFSKHLSEIKIIALDETSLDKEKCILLSDNPAERAYISSVLLMSGIRHGFDRASNVQLMLIDDFSSFEKNGDILIVTSKALETGCNLKRLPAWKALSETNNVFKASLPNREYYEFKQVSEKSRWCCRNLYGITHICINPEDLEISKTLEDGSQSILIVENGSDFFVLGADENVIGKTSAAFFTMLNELVAFEEIERLPASIDGILLVQRSGKICIYGMGHLKFVEY